MLERIGTPMINVEKLKTFIEKYKKDFHKLWKQEQFKWKAVKHFQDHWDINAPDFKTMFSQATAKTYSLLASKNNFPRSMIEFFATVDSGATRALFINLYDESKGITKRVEAFRTEAERLRVKYDDGKKASHYQDQNAISTYLWLRYPDKYYIYKFSECRKIAQELDSVFLPKQGDLNNAAEGFKLYDEIQKQLIQDEELIALFKSALSADCYPDPTLRTLSIDVGFYIYKSLPYKDLPIESEWSPHDYTPGLTKEDWLDLLADREIFRENNLEIMKRFIDFGGAATCSQLAAKYGETSNFYNGGSVAIAKRVQAKTGCPPPDQSQVNSRCWPILFVGKYTDSKEEGVYTWKLRDELRDALEEYDLSAVKLYANERTAGDYSTYTKDSFLSDVYISRNELNTLLFLLENKSNLILQGPPGVGKTYAAKRLAYVMMGEKDDSRVEFIQFHQSYSYEDFIMGFRPSGDGFELRNGVFYDFCQKATVEPDKPYLFIIDEINRGNISKIFGELLILIENTYRGTEATLAYSGETFSVPKNLYLIGLMNTADRSLAMLDYALRRRFSFFAMAPGFSSEGFQTYQKRIDDETLDALIERIKELNREIVADDSLGEGFRIGHSYFCNQTECTDEWLMAVVEFDILPMLREYWFDDKQKVQHWENILRGVLRD